MNRQENLIYNIKQKRITICIILFLYKSLETILIKTVNFERKKKIFFSLPVVIG